MGSQTVETSASSGVERLDRLIAQGRDLDLLQVLLNSADSSKVKTSLVERLNLPLLRSSAYLPRRTTPHPRKLQRITQHVELLRSWYNLMHPHGSQKLSGKYRAPAQQAGLAKRRLRFRDLFLGLTPPREEPTDILAKRGAAKLVYAWQLGG